MPTVRTNDLETDYERRGDGPAVVFVHASNLDAPEFFTTAMREFLARTDRA